LFAAHPQLLTPVLQIIPRGIARFLLKQTGRKRGVTFRPNGAGHFRRNGAT